MQARDQKRWQQLFRSLLQLPSGQAFDRIDEAERAAVQRIHGLRANDVKTVDERNNLDDALYVLHAFRTSEAINRDKPRNMAEIRV